MGQRPHLKLYLFWRYTFFATGPVLLLGLLALAHFGRQTTDAIESRNMVLARTIGGQVREALSEPYTLLRQVPLLLEASGDHRQRLAGLLTRTVQQAELLESITILDAQGRIDLIGVSPQLEGRREDLTGLDFSGQKFYRQALESGELVWSDTFLSLMSGRISLALCLPLDGRMLVATFNIDHLGRTVTQTSASEAYQVALVDNRGTLIFHTDPALARQHLNLRHLEPIAAGLDGTEGTFRYRWGDATHLGSVAPIRDAGWLVLVSQDASIAYAPLRELRNILVGAVCLTFLLSLLLALRNASRLSRPLRSLSRTAARIAGGDDGASLPPQSFREAEELAASLQRMLLDIHAREERQRSSQQHYARLFNLGSDAIFLHGLDPRGRHQPFEDANEAALQILGCSRQELLALAPKKVLLLHQDAPEHVHFLEQQLQREHRVTFETRLRNRAGQAIPVEIKAQLFFDEGQPKVLSIVRDIRERLATQQTLHTLVTSFVGSTGQQSLERILLELCRWLGTDGAGVGVRLTERELQPLAHYSDGAFQALPLQALPGTPAERVLAEGQLIFADGVQQEFPDDPFLRREKVEGYLGIALQDSQRRPLGVLMSFSRRPLVLPPNAWEMLQLMATKAATEIERSRDRQELELALAGAREAREKVGTILRSVHDGLIVCDAQRRIVLLNPAAEQLLGSAMAIAQGQPAAEVIRHPVLREHLLAVQLTEPDSINFDMDLKSPVSGEILTIQVRTTLVHNPRHSPTGTITSLRDVTREREGDRLKSEFISTAAHELQTPLTAVMGFSELLLRTDEFGPFSAAQQQEFLGEIHQKCESLSHIVDDLLDVSRMERGRPIALDRHWCDISELLRQTVKQHQRGETVGRFELSLPAQPLELRIDCHRINQVLDNLLSNAVNYSPDGGNIRVEAEPQAGQLEIRVIDQGIGIAVEQLDAIFDKFFRVDTRTTAVRGLGLGLGLSVARGIVEAHGGRIWAESSLGQGTTMHFTLPLPATDSAPDPTRASP